MTRILGHTWRQGYGFQGAARQYGPYKSYQAAWGRLRRAENKLAAVGLGEFWYTTAEKVERREDGYYLVGARVAEIG